MKEKRKKKKITKKKESLIMISLCEHKPKISQNGSFYEKKKNRDPLETSTLTYTHCNNSRCFSIQNDPFFFLYKKAEYFF